MAKVQLTVRNIKNLGLWEKVCDYKGWDYYLVNEGRISEDEFVEFDDQFKKDTNAPITTNELVKLQNVIMDLDVDQWIVDDSVRVIKTLQHYETVLEKLKDEWEGYTHFSGQDGMDACLVMEIVEKFKTR